MRVNVNKIVSGEREKDVETKTRIGRKLKENLNKFLRSPIDSSQFFAILRGVQVVYSQGLEKKI